MSGGVAVDFWHSAAFSWDGKVVNFIGESFGTGCPTVSTWSNGTTNDTGAMFFLSTATGSKFSHFALPRPSSLPRSTLTTYGNDGVEDPPTGEGFQVFSAEIGVDEDRLRYLNPQTQVRLIDSPTSHLAP